MIIVKKSILVVSMFLMLFSANVSNAQVAVDNYASVSNEDTRAIERADVIEKKYRVYDGVLQYRHWNATQGRWVEPDWISIS